MDYLQGGLRMTKKLPEDVKLRRLIRRTVESRKNFLDKPDRSNYRQIISTFLEKYILCEAGTKRALSAYYSSKGDTKEIKDINMPITDIKAALINAGFETNTMELDKMFKKDGLRGERSARDLRNAIVHDLSVNDIDELVKRWEDIQKTLDSYLSCLQNEALE